MILLTFDVFGDLGCWYFAFFLSGFALVWLRLVLGCGFLKFHAFLLCFSAGRSESSFASWIGQPLVNKQHLVSFIYLAIIRKFD